MRELKIVEANNGYVLSRDVEQDENVWIEEIDVVEETDDTNDLFRRLLEKVAEHFGMQYDKFSSENLNITFDKKGHKVE